MESNWTNTKIPASNPPPKTTDAWTSLLPAMKRTSATNSSSLLFHAGELLDSWRNGSSTFEIKEFGQFLNPAIRPALRNIKQVFMQPAMTPGDQRCLDHYKTNYHKKKLLSQPGDKLFKLEIADYTATDSEFKYSLRFAPTSILYSQVIAITYAWHETTHKHTKKVGREGGKPSETLKLGSEWNVDAFLESLVELSKTNWIWMDQFSLDQNNVTTEEITSDIPTIYRNARVVAFLPYTVCGKALANVNTIRTGEAPNVSTALAEMMLHDLVCECTDGIYGWLSRLWTWQELMLATSLRFVWGLGESRWSRREYLNKQLNLGIGGWIERHFSTHSPESEDQKVTFSRLWERTAKAGKTIKNVVKYSVTNVSVFEQPITKLLNELTKRTSESVIIPKSESATLSMSYYFCVQLLCGAEVYLPSASETSPINCLKVLQQLASSGRKGGRLYDCYYAAAAFIKHPNFLPEKTKMNDVKTELSLRYAYIGLYERENARLRLPKDKLKLLDDPGRLLQAYTELFVATYNHTPRGYGQDIAALRRDYTDLYHRARGNTVVTFSGAPVPNYGRIHGQDFHPIAWEKNSNSRLNLTRLNGDEFSSPWNDELVKKRAGELRKESNGEFLNAFVLSGMNEESFCEARGDFYGTAYDIISIKRIELDRMQDVWANSIYKIVKYLHPSQLTRVRNFNTIPIDMNVQLYPLAHAIIHATCFRDDEYPAHLAHVVSALRGKTIATRDYVNAVAMLVGEGFDFVLGGKGEQENQFELAKITFSDGTRCVGIISSLVNETLAQAVGKSTSASAAEMTKLMMPVQKFSSENVTGSGYRASLKRWAMEKVVEPTQTLVVENVLAPAQKLAIKKVSKAIASSLAMSSVKVVKSHHRLLLCGNGGNGGNVSDWNVVGYIPGVDAEVNEAALGPISHSNVRVKMVETGTLRTIEV